MSSIESVNHKAERIKYFVNSTLSAKFHIPVYIDDEVARIIAASILNKGGDTCVWLNGRRLKLNDLRLELNLDSLSEPMKR